jgi:rod shape-determining protein MreD
MMWVRYAIGLLLALTLHSLLNSFFPNALAFFNPYIILVVYYAMSGNLLGTLIAAVIAGFVQDAYSGAIFGMHAFSMTVAGYLVAYVSSRLVLRGTIAFAGALLGAIIINELVIFILVNIMLRQRIELFEEGALLKTILTTVFGVLIYQLVHLFVREKRIDAARRTAW